MRLHRLGSLHIHIDHCGEHVEDYKVDCSKCVRLVYPKDMRGTLFKDQNIKDYLKKKYEN